MIQALLKRWIPTMTDLSLSSCTVDTSTNLVCPDEQTKYPAIIKRVQIQVTNRAV